ncbi:DUF4335 domain-containing protein [Cronbergia sp. UHCC 0137]|uniref:DUF4335 domain-containing protein n=1 Tax=Cronbergia sp. UHCC 0137 TaxID=3110239 RepID=UPI002B1FCAAB|nr:DUF4335 domain-containing protein [Cronbergia sp. UHCC 0137]MEA5617734.1 DUF4335 domain-containing protein [Cronbergia sp. UHCC 0137]
MSRSNSVIRRYTPPTCTLEILAQSSPLSRWMGKTVLKQVSFNLYFDDPRLPEKNRVPIQGDRDQLEALCDAVTSYIQHLLQQSTESFWMSFTSTDDQLKATSTQLQSQDLDKIPLSAKTLQFPHPNTPQTKIYLESTGNLTHQLFLGSLANSTSGASIQLTLLQLFDLATALDEYSADMMALPTSMNQSSPKKLPNWASAAAVLVLAAGLIPLTWQYANSDRPTQETATYPESSLALKTPQAKTTSPTNLAPTPANTLSPLQLATPAPRSSSNTTPTLAFPDASDSITTQITPKDPLNPAFPANLQIPLPPPVPNSPNSTKSINPTGITLTTRENLSPQNTSIVPKTGSSISRSIGTIPNTSPQLPPALDLQPKAKVNDANLTNQPSETAKTTLFDTPQVAEARDFLKKKWQPPTGLSDTLEYSLMLGTDGTIERILPLNQAARQYIDNTGIPEIGKPFVSINKYGQNVRLRAVLSPDGKVQTFPENP